MNYSFRTEIPLTKSDHTIDYESSLIMIGSCFSDHIGGLLEQYKFQVLLNPYGVLYNPASIAQVLRKTLEQSEITINDLIEHKHSWHSFLFHGSFSGENPDEVVEKTNTSLRLTHKTLKGANTLFITFGTAWVYSLKATGQVVSNCHKLPAAQFTRFRLAVNDIVFEWKSLIDQLLKINPKLKIIFTVSPVRHLKDGMHENQLSKATLLLAIEELSNSFPNKEVSYFPSYEIVQDDLRDYRFYTDDMLHITDAAVNYIFEKFKTVYFSENTIQILKEVKELVQLSNHRILTNNSIEIEKFAILALTKIKYLEEKYPNIKFELEKSHFKNLS